jgi:hypothetical protein
MDARLRLPVLGDADLQISERRILAEVLSAAITFWMKI